MLHVQWIILVIYWVTNHRVVSVLTSVRTLTWCRQYVRFFDVRNVWRIWRNKIIFLACLSVRMEMKSCWSLFPAWVWHCLSVSSSWKHHSHFALVIYPHLWLTFEQWYIEQQVTTSKQASFQATAESGHCTYETIYLPVHDG